METRGQRRIDQLTQGYPVRVSRTQTRPFHFSRTASSDRIAFVEILKRKTPNATHNFSQMRDEQKEDREDYRVSRTFLAPCVAARCGRLRNRSPRPRLSRLPDHISRDQRGCLDGRPLRRRRCRSSGNFHNALHNEGQTEREPSM